MSSIPSQSMRRDALAIREPQHEKPWLGRGAFTRFRSSIDYYTNEWRRHIAEYPHLPQTSVSSYLKPTAILRAVPAVRKRWTKRWTIAALMVLLCVLLSVRVRVLAGPEEPASTGALSADTSKLHIASDTFGTNQRPNLASIKQTSTLASSLLPGSSQLKSGPHGRRLIFIGDIHGCYEELTRLLAKTGYNDATDHIISTGDIINKGPSSEAVVDFLVAQGASCVRGNHDDKILLKASQIDALGGQHFDTEDLEMRLAMSLTATQLHYLQSCPIVLHVGSLPYHGDIVVVHGGLVPSSELEHQDPWAVMNMRIIHPLTHVPSKEHEREGHVAWADLWNQNQEQNHSGQNPSPDDEKKMLATYLGTTVVYGHDAKRGLQIQRYTKGLDSGCVKGRKLTALVLSDKPKEEIYQVKCKQYV